MTDMTEPQEDVLARLADGDLRNLEYWAREAYTADHLPLTDGGQDNVARFRSMLTSEVVLSLIAELRAARAAARGEHQEELQAQGTSVEDIEQRLAAGYPAKSQTASLMLAVADVSALLAVVAPPVDPVGIAAQGFTGHKPLPNGKCEHRWRNRTTVQVHCGWAEGYAAGRAATEPADGPTNPNAVDSGLVAGTADRTLDAERWAARAFHWQHTGTGDNCGDCSHHAHLFAEYLRPPDPAIAARDGGET